MKLERHKDSNFLLKGTKIPKDIEKKKKDLFFLGGDILGSIRTF
jgi:hypothetical protein